MLYFRNCGGVFPCRELKSLRQAALEMSLVCGGQPGWCSACWGSHGHQQGGGVDAAPPHYSLRRMIWRVLSRTEGLKQGESRAESIDVLHLTFGRSHSCKMGPTAKPFKLSWEGSLPFNKGPGQWNNRHIEGCLLRVTCICGAHVFFYSSWCWSCPFTSHFITGGSCVQGE